MAVSLASSLLWLPLHSRHVFRAPPFFSTGSSSLLFFLTRCSETSSSTPRCLPASRTSSHSEGTDNGSTGTGLLDGGLLRRVAGAKDSDQVLEAIAECRGDGIGVVSTDECCSIIEAALERNNTDLALSVFSAMRSSSGEGLSEEGSCVGRWKWGRPDLRTYGLLVRGLARALKVSDAFRIIANVSLAGISSGEEVPFGKIVRCPTCMIAIAVAQPQHGTQLLTFLLLSYDLGGIEGGEAQWAHHQLLVLPASCSSNVCLLVPLSFTYAAALLSGTCLCRFFLSILCLFLFFNRGFFSLLDLKLYQPTGNWLLG